MGWRTWGLDAPTHTAMSYCLHDGDSNAMAMAQAVHTRWQDAPERNPQHRGASYAAETRLHECDRPSLLWRCGWFDVEPPHSHAVCVVLRNVDWMRPSVSTGDAAHRGG